MIDDQICVIASLLGSQLLASLKSVVCPGMLGLDVLDLVCQAFSDTRQKNFGKVKKSQDFLVQVYRWESWVNTLRRDHQQDVVEKVRVGLAHHDGSRRAARGHLRTCGSFAELCAGQGSDGDVVGSQEQTAEPQRHGRGIRW